VKPATLAGKRRDLGEFQAWLLQNTPHTLLTFQPADFEAYLLTWATLWRAFTSRRSSKDT